jgi:hypothetical protein
MPVRPKIPTSPPPSPFVDSHGAATYLCISEQTLAAWRLKGLGPRFAKLNTKIVYRIDDLRAFATERTVTSTSQIAYHGRPRGRPPILDRLDREGHAELAARVRAGELSISAAAFEAGFKPRPRKPAPIIEGEGSAVTLAAQPPERALRSQAEAAEKQQDIA